MAIIATSDEKEGAIWVQRIYKSLFLLSITGLLKQKTHAK